MAASQWSAARRTAADAGVRLKGDLPFMVAGDSADVWARAGEFDLQCNVGAPPDAFNERGQDWGLPVYRWDVMAATDFAWLRARMAGAARLFDAVRVDHVVGYCRLWVLGRGAEGRFVPSEQGAQPAACSLDGVRAVVTGASSGIGAAIAEAFGGAGATVLVTHRDSAEAASAVAERIMARAGSHTDRRDQRSAPRRPASGGMGHRRRSRIQHARAPVMLPQLRPA